MIPSSVYLFASGKGGVGKSTITANLAVILARAGYPVALIDADIGLRGQDAMLGMENRVVYDLLDAAYGRCLLSQALLSDLSLPNLHLLPASQFARAKDLEPKALRRIISVLRETHRFIIIDCPAGLERGLRNVLNAGADETVLVVTPDDLCIRDAERTCALIDSKRLPRPRIIVNRLQNDLIYDREMLSARTVAQTLDLPLLGEIPDDSAVTLSQLRHQMVVDYRCEARQALLRIAGRMAGTRVDFPEYGKEKTPFFRRYFPRKPVKDPLLTIRLGTVPGNGYPQAAAYSGGITNPAGNINPTAAAYPGGNTNSAAGAYPGSYTNLAAAGRAGQIPGNTNPAPAYPAPGETRAADNSPETVQSFAAPVVEIPQKPGGFTDKFTKSRKPDTESIPLVSPEEEKKLALALREFENISSDVNTNEPQAQAVSQPQTQTVSQPQPQTVSQPQPQTQAVSQPQPQAQAVSQPQPQTVSQPQPQTRPLTQSAVQPQAQPQQGDENR